MMSYTETSEQQKKNGSKSTNESHMTIIQISSEVGSNIMSF